MSSWKESALHHKYAELPEEFRYKKKKKKKLHIKAKHKHCYASMLFDCGHHVYYVVEYCVICGRINNITINNILDPTLPVHKASFKDLFMAKRINLEDVSVC